MSLLNSASLVVTPNAYKEGTLYSVIPNTTLGDMTVVRATTATRVNSAGLVEVVPYNLLTYSEQFNNAAWIPNASPTITANSITAPNGTLTADTIAAGGANSGVYQVPTVSVAVAYAFSVYVKNISSSTAITIGCDLNPINATLSFNAVSGTITSVGAGITASAVTNEGNGWFRVFGTYVTTNTPNTFIVFGGGVMSFAVWGAQLVEGTLPKDYVRTETRLNIPRLDYSNGTCPSLLVEPQRTNLITYSSTFTNAIWTQDNSSLTSGFTSPSGAADAFKLIESATTAVHNIYITFLSLTLGNYTTSIYIKKGERFKVAVADRHTGVYVSYNLNTGTIIDSLSLVGTIESLDNDWYRLTATTSSTVSVYVPQFFILQDSYTTGLPITLPYLGDGTSGIYIWGAQLEAGSYSTSYIPTTSAAVTRNADAIYKTGISSLIGQTEGVMFCDFVCVNNSSYCDVMAIGTDGTTGVIELQINGAASNTLSATYYYGGFVANIPALATLTIGQRYKAAFAYKSNDFVFYLNGVQQGTDTSGTVVSGMSEVSLNGYNSSTANKENALINSAILFPTRLTNAELASLTTI